jgi:hypothetical protein
MAATKRRYSKEEFARRGDAIYEKDILPHLKPDDEGKFVAIDIESGAYEMDRDELAACDKAECPPSRRSDLDGADRLTLCASLRRHAGPEPRPRGSIGSRL